ncbi:TRAP transporter small permease subunit [Sagittula sp. P11]|uniref:TRAP transporter small permease subunit n=1 Tax=Sagittula sp. P11 TaxID=2009329 RepID=UPI0018E2335B|nr:TRAP transporter small permease subunit [Sagittula sp. P11]
MTRVLAAYPEDRIALREVGLRDGLQMPKTWPTTTQKLEWVTRGAAAGVRYFETGSFLSADKVPRFADVREVIGAVAAQGGHGVALAMNKRGAVDALASDVPEITVVISASAAHNEANVRLTQEQSLSAIADVARLRDETGKGTIINAGIATAFGCSIVGDVSGDDVMRMVERRRGFHALRPDSPLLWSDEVTGWALVAMISCGVAEAYRRGDHIAIDLLTDRLRGPSRAVQRVFAALAVLVLSGVLFLSTWEAVEFFRMFGSYTTGHLEIPGWIPQAPLMLAAAMLVLVALTRILDTLAGRSQ